MCITPSCALMSIHPLRLGVDGGRVKNICVVSVLLSTSSTLSASTGRGCVGCRRGGCALNSFHPTSVHQRSETEWDRER